MRKVVIAIALLSMLLNLIGCNSNKLSLPKYISKESYYSEGIQDYTDYCKYFYDEEGISNFEESDSFTVVEESNIKNIKIYFEHFEECIKEESFSDKYDFNCDTQIKVGDYFHITTKEGVNIGDSSYGKFDYYDVYYVDMEKRILYFIHSNS